MSFYINIINIHGDEGKEWLLNLPTIVEQCAVKYGLSDLKPVDNLTFNYVLSGMQGEQSIILKLGLTTELLSKEADALRAFNGHGAIRLFTEENGMLLLERATCGISLKNSLSEGRKDEALSIICNIVKKLHSAPIPKYHTFSAYCRHDKCY